MAGEEMNNTARRNEQPGRMRRVLYALAGLFAGEAALILFLLQNAVHARALLRRAHTGAPEQQIPLALQIFVIYAAFAFAGWVIVGVPFALAVSSRRIGRLPWPVLLLLGVALGPLALLLILVALGARAGAFSMSHTASLWPFSVLVSVVSFAVYAGLVRRRVRRRD